MDAEERGDGEMSEGALEVYRAAGYLNKAISGAVHAGYKVTVDQTIFCTYGGYDVTEVRVEVLRPILPDKRPVALSEPA